MSERRFVVRPDGARLAYQVSGAGEPLLLVSPLAGSIELWGRLAELLAEQARVIAFDHRGLGASSDVRLGVTTRALAQDALAVLDDAGVERADVFGVSLGGMVATWVAADAAARVRRLVLASTLARGAGVVRSPRSLWRGARLASCVVRPGQVGRCLGEGLLSDAFHAANPAEAARLEQQIADAPRSRGAIVALGAAAVRHDASGALHRVRAPTLLLSGEHDDLIRAGRQRRSFAALADVRVETIAAAGHAVDVEAPEQVAARIVAFLRGGRARLRW